MENTNQEALELKFGELLLKKMLLKAEAEQFANVPNLLNLILPKIDKVDAELDRVYSKINPTSEQT